MLEAYEKVFGAVASLEAKDIPFNMEWYEKEWSEINRRKSDLDDRMEQVRREVIKELTEKLAKEKKEEKVASVTSS